MKEIKNVAVIMDGNGRWAQARLRPRVWGHIRGAARVAEIVEKASELNLSSLTMYAFSTENWSRPKDEILLLFRILRKFLIKEADRIIQNNIQFKIIGDISNLDIQTKKLVHELEAKTLDNDGLKLSFAFSYGARKEIVDAVNSFIAINPNKKITENDLSHFLYRPEVAEIDLLIRTAGELRISNFLLWQISYAELYFTQTKWPDFNSKEFEKIISEVSTRERRFGSIGLNRFSLEPTVSEPQLSRIIHGS